MIPTKTRPGIWSRGLSRTARRVKPRSRTTRLVPGHANAPVPQQTVEPNLESVRFFRARWAKWESEQLQQVFFLAGENGGIFRKNKNGTMM